MISYQTMLFDDEYAIAVAWDINRIYKYDYVKNKMYSIKCFKPINKLIIAPYGGIYKYTENKYLFSPLGAKEILIYDRGNECCRKIQIRDYYEENWLEEIVPYGRYLYLIPGNYNAIVRFDCETEEIEYIEDCITDIICKYGMGKGEIFHRGYALIESTLYIACIRYKGIILKLNLEDYSYEIIDIKRDITSICCVYEKCYMSTDQGAILMWSPSENKIEECIEPEKSSRDKMFFEIIGVDKYVIALPWKHSRVLIYDVEKKMKKEVVLTHNQDALCMFGKGVGNFLYTFSHSTKKIYKIKITTGIIEREVYVNPSEDDEIMFWEGYQGGYGEGIYLERDKNSLSQFIDSLLENT